MSQVFRTRHFMHVHGAERNQLARVTRGRCGWWPNAAGWFWIGAALVACALLWLSGRTADAEMAEGLEELRQIDEARHKACPVPESGERPMERIEQRNGRWVKVCEYVRAPIPGMRVRITERRAGLAL